MQQRNRKQVGYIYHRGGWWWLRYRQRAMVNGEIRTVQRAKRLAPKDSTYKTRASVRALAEDSLEPINKRSYAPEATTTLGDFVDRIYLPHVKDHKRPSTYAGYKDAWQRHLRPRCGDAWLREIRTPDVQRWLEIVSEEDSVSKTTLKHIKHLLSGIFRFAAQQDYFDRANPVTPTSIPSNAAQAAETHAYSLEEIEKMLKVLPEPAATVVAVAAFTGLRRGEIRGLCWEDFQDGDSDEMALLRVKRSVWNGIATEPKTAKSRSPVPVIAPLANRLRTHFAKSTASNGPIFANSASKSLDLAELYRRGMADVLRLEQIQWHGWHAFRRGLATNLHRLGINDKTIQAILRHSNISTTQNVYIKSIPADSIAAMRQLESVIGNTGGQWRLN